jgi:hypothetical protein
MRWSFLKMITIPVDRSTFRTTHIPIPTKLLAPTNSGTQRISDEVGRSGIIGKTLPR